MRFKRILHLIKKHNKNGLPLLLDLPSFDIFWRTVRYVNTHFIGFTLVFAPRGDYLITVVDDSTCEDFI